MNTSKHVTITLPISYSFSDYFAICTIYSLSVSQSSGWFATGTQTRTNSTITFVNYDAPILWFSIGF